MFTLTRVPDTREAVEVTVAPYGLRAMFPNRDSAARYIDAMWDITAATHMQAAAEAAAMAEALQNCERRHVQRLAIAV